MGTSKSWMLICAWVGLSAAACSHGKPPQTREQTSIPKKEEVRVAEVLKSSGPPWISPTSPYGQDVARDLNLPQAVPTKPTEAASQPAPALAEPQADRNRRARSASKAASLDAMGALGVGTASGAAYGVGGGGLGIRGVMAAPPAAAPVLEMNREAYAHVAESDFSNVHDAPLSTFSVDVDTASYANVRRFLRQGSLPPADAVRIEELVNYFDYDYPQPRNGEPFSIYAEVGACPWNSAHKLVHIGVQGREVAREKVPPRNLVFLVDVSGSMQSADKLPLLKRGLAMLADNLRPEDRVAIAVYAGSSGLALPSTTGRDQARIREALGQLEAGGSTNGAAGIELAYQVAQEHFVKGGINRVILATDGDFNVGVTSEGELVRLIEQKRKSGVFLTVLGFGTGNYQDQRMEQLADKGNGNYAYIDSLAEAQKVLVREAGSTLVTIAKDVKLQVEWNPAHVASYRLIGYENRALAARDFNDDKKDAGEIGAGHNVTALYEIVPAGADDPAATPEVDALRYQSLRQANAQALSNELLTIKIRYKAPNADQSQLLTRTLADESRALDASSDAFRFSAAVAGFGMLLRHSDHKGQATLQMVTDLASGATERDPHGDRHELLDMLRAAARLGLGS